MKCLKSILIVLPFLIPLHSIAWGVTGHRVVGGIAEKYLTAHTRQEIRKILGNESTALASTWADFIKSDTSYNYLSSWHYLDLPPGLDSTQFMAYLKTDTGTDVYTKLNLVIRQLKVKSLPNEKKVFFLRLLIHLVGDIHQPMHVSHLEDKGGNDIRVSWFSTPSNLHRIWDENLIDFQQLSYTEYISAINFTTPAQLGRWQKQPLSQWLMESYRISEKLYTEVKSDDKLGYVYNFNHIAIVNQRLLQGGVRLAGLLNEIFR